MRIKGGFLPTTRAFRRGLRVRFCLGIEFDGVALREFGVGVLAEEASVPAGDVAPAEPAAVVLDVALVQALRDDVIRRALPEVVTVTGLSTPASSPAYSSIFVKMR